MKRDEHHMKIYEIDELWSNINANWRASMKRPWTSINKTEK